MILIGPISLPSCSVRCHFDMKVTEWLERWCDAGMVDIHLTKIILKSMDFSFIIK